MLQFLQQPLLPLLPKLQKEMVQVAATNVYLKMSIDTHRHHNRSVADLIHSTCSPQQVK